MRLRSVLHDGRKGYRTAKPTLQSTAPGHSDRGLDWSSGDTRCRIQCHPLLAPARSLAREQARRQSGGPGLHWLRLVRVYLEHAALEFALLNRVLACNAGE